MSSNLEIFWHMHEDIFILKCSKFAGIVVQILRSLITFLFFSCKNKASFKKKVSKSAILSRFSRCENHWKARCRCHRECVKNFRNVERDLKKKKKSTKKLYYALILFIIIISVNSIYLFIWVFFSMIAKNLDLFCFRKRITGTLKQWMG